MSIISFSQNGSMKEKDYINSPKILIDSSGVELLAFTREDLDIIQKELKLAGLNNKKIKQLSKKINLLNDKLISYKELTDSLESQYNKCITITLDKNAIINVNEIQIDLLKEQIENYKNIKQNDDVIKNNLKITIDTIENKVKRKNKMIFGLTVTNILTATILILSL